MTIPSRLKTHFAVVALSWAAMGCSYADGPVQRPRPLSAPRATAPAVNSAGLPSGWSWPFNPKSGAAVFSQLATIRPVDLSRLIPNVGRGPCAPTQVAPFVWVAPNCSAAMTKPLAASPYVVHRSSFQEQSGLPPAVDLREQGLDGPVKYQQMVGVCWAFAISTVMDNAVRRAGRQDVLSPLHVVAANPWNDIWSKGRSDRSLTLEPVWSYDPVKACKLNEAKSEVWCGEAYHVEPGSWRSDPALVAEREHANRSGEYTITHIESFDVKPGNPSQIAAAVATGRAVFASFNINTPVWGERGSAGPDIPNYQATDGAHAVAIVGYKTTPGGLRFLLHNSWGVEWRDHGYAWISEAMVRQHLLDAFTLEVSAPLGNAHAAPNPNPGPQPKPTPNPAASGCPTGQARDLVFGWCAPACPNGAPPVAMVCAASGSQPAPTPAACPAGQTRDWITGSCTVTCRNGLPSAAGLCLP